MFLSVFIFACKETAGISTKSASKQKWKNHKLIQSSKLLKKIELLFFLEKIDKNKANYERKTAENH